MKQNDEEPAIILVVDDVPNNLDVLVQILEEEGYRVCSALTGTSALEIIPKIKPNLILLDIVLPDINGFEVCQQIKPKYDIPVIFSTGKASDADLKRGFDIGGVDYIRKPIHREEVIARVRTHIQLAKALAEVKANRDQLEHLVAERTKDLVLAHKEAIAANEAKSMFLANMSHELRTPLNAVIGYSEILSDEISELDHAEVQNLLSTINVSGKQLLSIINEILDITKIESGKLELDAKRFYINDLLKDLVTTVQPLVLANNNTIETEFTSGLGQLYSDYEKVYRIIMNLLTNATKFTHNGLINFSVARNGNGRTKFTVKDNGIGIEPEKQNYLFSEFYQVDSTSTRQYGGVGLGLAICKRYVDLLGGSIDIKSELEKGSEFIVEIPDYYI